MQEQRGIEPSLYACFDRSHRSVRMTTPTCAGRTGSSIVKDYAIAVAGTGYGRCEGQGPYARDFPARLIRVGESRMKRKLKICLVGSSGGHLAQLYLLKPFWQDHDRFWVTFDKEDARSLLRGERMYPCYFPSNRSLKAFVINTVRAFRILPKERPDLIVSTGAAPAVPFFYIGKLFGAKTVYIEVFDRIDAPTLSGRLCYPVTDRFIVQWEEMKRVYPGAINLGSIF